MRTDLNFWVPFGMDGKKETRWILSGLALAAAVSVLNFAIHYQDALSNLYYRSRKTNLLRPGATMPAFSEIIVGCDTLFALVCLVMPFLAAYHYLYHFRGARSIYLMRRLPSRWELHRRCLTVPAMGLLAALALLGLLGIVFYMVYLFCTPAQCLPV